MIWKQKRRFVREQLNREWDLIRIIGKGGVPNHLAVIFAHTITATHYQRQAIWRKP